jgi:DNA-binding CsgD family transcriptional regulator
MFLPMHSANQYAALRTCPAMKHLTRNDYAAALALVARLQPAASDARTFAQETVLALTEFVASELTTLSECDLTSGRRRVVGMPGERLGERDIECFDRHFFEHPLVRYHGFEGGRVTRRISDSLSRSEFRRSAIYADYYLRVGLEHTVAVPLLIDEHRLVSVVLNRRGLDFSERDCERLEVLRPHLAFLYRQAGRHDASPGDTEAATLLPTALDAEPEGLTPRENEVLHWLAHGKTDAEIAALLGLSPRTVQKHLEHIYIKLGVETRTAAVMRSIGKRLPH